MRAIREILGYLSIIKLHNLVTTFLAGSLVMLIWSKIKVKGGQWFGLFDILSGVIVIALGSVVYKFTVAKLAKWSY